jgi:hypothetical protein
MATAKTTAALAAAALVVETPMVSSGQSCCSSLRMSAQ